MTPPTHQARAAVFYTRIGLSVLAELPDGSKHPAHKWKHLQQAAQTEAEVQAWWRQHPDHNVAIVTGAVSGLVVVDADDADAVAAVECSLPWTPWQVQSARGVHFGYAHPGPPVARRVRVGCRAPAGSDDHGACWQGGAFCHVDVLGEASKCTLPPSRHKSGVLYQWRVKPWEYDGLPVFDPRWLPEPLERVPVQMPEGQTAEGALRQARAWLSKRDPAVQRQGGDQHTAKTAWSLAHRGLSWADAWALLCEWNQTCQPPWREGDLRVKLSTAWRK